MENAQHDIREEVGMDSEKLLLKYGYRPNNAERKSVLITYRLTKGDAEALMETVGSQVPGMSLSQVARLATLEWIEENREG